LFDDPYKILGLTPGATDEQIKQAYRRLAKKYHPDMNPDDPAAAKMMNDINAAYEQIKNPPQQHAYQNAYDPFAGWQRQDYGRESGPSGIQAARHYIRYGSYDSALNALSGVPVSQRNAEWYYLSAVANSRMGNRVIAMEHIHKAVDMEPGNEMYRRAMERMQNPGSVYEGRQQGAYHNVSNMLFNCCYTCAALNICCGGGRFIWPFCFC